MDGNEPSELNYDSYTFDKHCSAMFRLSQIRLSVTSALCAIAADAVNSSFESFSSSFIKITFYQCESPLTKKCVMNYQVQTHRRCNEGNIDLDLA